ncbi:MAG: hypothetical protein GX241_02730 [Ruminococcaceae bacterium]|nr:hypothetical protein [Oscillospiraceae bacterium]
MALVTVILGGIVIFYAYSSGVCGDKEGENTSKSPNSVVTPKTDEEPSSNEESTNENKEPSEDVSKDESKDDSINIVYGELGEYGEMILINGKDFPIYKIPAGKYTITNNANKNGNWCEVRIAKDTGTKDANGNIITEVKEGFEFSKVGDTKVVLINEGEHIEVTMYANITLKPEK